MPKDSTKNYRENFLGVMAEIEDTYYNKDEIPEIRRFVEEYDSKADYSKICFSWNGKFGEEFVDNCQTYRDKISIFICLNNEIKVQPTLLRDLIQEIGKASKKSWGAPEYLLLISERLLTDTGETYVEDYGKMLFSSMDTYGACVAMDFSSIDIKSILKELYGKEQKDKNILNLIEYFESK